MSASSADYPSTSRAVFMLGTVLLVMISGYLDRQIISVLVGAIRQDLLVSNTQIGMLQGVAFAALYCTLGMPVGYLVDRHNRRNIMIGGVLCWSVATAACGFANSFGQLFTARVFVGIGEACLAPAAMSLIADAFPPQQRGRALSLYGFGGVAGAALSLVLAGLILRLAQKFGGITLPLVGLLAPWRAAFVIAGLSGLAAVALLAAIGEVTRKEAAAVAGDGKLALLGYLREHKALFFVYGAYAFHAVISYSLFAWVPTLFAHRYNTPIASIGIGIGAIVLLGGIAGCGAGGIWADAWTRTKVRAAKLAVFMAVGLAAVPAVVATLTAASLSIAYLAFAIVVVAVTCGLAIGPSILQDLFPNQLRGRAAALYTLINGCIGLAAGPLAVGWASDHVFAGDDALRFALGTVVLSSLGIAVVCAWCAARSTDRIRSGVNAGSLDAPDPASGLLLQH